MGEDELFFFGESIRHARQLPLGDCLQFLRGMLVAMKDDHTASAKIRSIIAQLTQSDAQLELIQVGEHQTRFGLDSDTHRAGPRRAGRKGTQ